ncbi:DUF2796 domain-containing protein [Piscinibacter sp.]|uniref:DUF2796 domain-containing protein n=1 Tax=Piscinibacter sp. TaxID=1903157 RepID=UPI002D7F5809|nr:DUF2796 domain-containing protein [Albitalea sp.]
MLSSFVVLAPAMAASPHQHGAARLDVAVEGERITLSFESPLDNLVGFERAARTDAERQRAEAAVAQLKAADAMFTIDGAAQCTPVKAELNSAALALGSGADADHGDGHAEIEGLYEFDCKNASRAGFIDVGLFEAFPRMRRIDVQVVAPKGQMKAVLKRPSRRISLVR